MRLGSEGISEEMQSEEFFVDQDFEAVYNHEIVPEFHPPTSDDMTDVSNFDTVFTQEAPQDSLVTNRLTKSAEEKSIFHGFTYMDGRRPMESGMGGGMGRSSEGVVKKNTKEKGRQGQATTLVQPSATTPEAEPEWLQRE